MLYEVYCVNPTIYLENFDSGGAALIVVLIGACIAGTWKGRSMLDLSGILFGVQTNSLQLGYLYWRGRRYNRTGYQMQRESVSVDDHRDAFLEEDEENSLPLRN